MHKLDNPGLAAVTGPGGREDVKVSHTLHPFTTYHTSPSMSVIAHFRVPSDSFELGRVLVSDPEVPFEFENRVPLGETAVTFTAVDDASRATLEERVRDHLPLESLHEVGRTDHETLYALNWTVSRDLFLEGVVDHGGQLLRVSGGSARWEFEIRFPDHEELEAFQHYCADAHVPLEVGRVFNPTRSTSGKWYDLTGLQRETLIRAVECEYYDIPRDMSTKELAEEFDITDQAITERLRRAIVTLVHNSLLATDEPEQWDRVD